MKSLIKILSILFIFSAILLPQEKQEFNAHVSSDSLKIKIQENPLIQMQIKFDEFELHREFKDMKMSVPIDGDPNTVWLRTSLALSNTINTEQNFSPHFLSPLEKQYLKNSKFNPISYVLGMVQTGAVGYLAYKHIKKYGFLK